MPIYSFKCQNCGFIFDLLINVTSNNEKPKCEKCKSEKITRIFSNFSVGHSNSKCDSETCDIVNNKGGCCPGCEIK